MDSASSYVHMEESRNGTSNKIDYITINEQFRISVTQVEAEADYGSDHSQIVPTVRVNIRKLLRKKSQPKLQTDMPMSENEY